MSNRNNAGRFIATVMISGAIGFTVGHFGYEMATQHRHADASSYHHTQGDGGSLAYKDYRLDPAYQGNAPQGGGLNADSGPGVYQANPVHPPMEKRHNPAPPMRLMVAEGSSVWQTVAQAFPGCDPNFLVATIVELQTQIDWNPALKVRDLDIVPVGYTFIVDIDGGHAFPEV